MLFCRHFLNGTNYPVILCIVFNFSLAFFLRGLRNPEIACWIPVIEFVCSIPGKAMLRLCILGFVDSNVTPITSCSSNKWPIGVGNFPQLRSLTALFLQLNLFNKMFRDQRHVMHTKRKLVPRLKHLSVFLLFLESINLRELCYYNFFSAKITYSRYYTFFVENKRSG